MLIHIFTFQLKTSRVIKLFVHDAEIKITDLTLQLAMLVVLTECVQEQLLQLYFVHNLSGNFFPH